MSLRTIEETRQRVAIWEATIRGDSPLYSRLARHVADDAELLDLIRAAPPGQLGMNLLLAAVQALLIEDPSAPLAQWYPSLGGECRGAGLEQTFTAYVHDHRDEIRRMVATRRVQTNEVARCAFLLPAYNMVAETAGRELAIIEVGTSAGLTQNLDRYGYTYCSSAGDVKLSATATVQLSTDAGDRVPPAAQTLPPIASRTGLDLHPIDLTDPEQARWLRSLVWPDQVERHRRLAAAIELAQEHRPGLVAGDAITLLPRLVLQAQQDAVVVIQHSFVLNQFERSERQRLLRLLDSMAERRTIYRVAAEWLGRLRATTLEISRHGPDRTTIELGRVHHHGRWIRLDPQAAIPR